MIHTIGIFIPLFIALGILYGLSQLTDQMVMRILGRNWYIAVMWPGVIIHELSHLIGCLITFTRVYKVKFFQPSGETLGYVSYSKTRNPIVNVIISIAPLFGTSLVIWILVRLLLPEVFGHIASQFYSSALKLNLTSLNSAFQLYWDSLYPFLTSLPFSDWKLYLFIYLMITLASHAAPSKIDLKHTVFGILGIAAFFMLLAGIDSIFHASLSQTIAVWLTRPLYYLALFILFSAIFTLCAFCILAIFSIVKRTVSRK